MVAALNIYSTNLIVHLNSHTIRLVNTTRYLTCTPPPPHTHTQGEWVSMGVYTGTATYGIPAGVVYSFPITIKPGGEWKIVEGLTISDFAREKMDITAKELQDEKETALQFLSANL